ncbi:MAG: RecX family transcriptional regulator [Bacteroidia bacterium]|nr:RecX family transcriptional regulator [Bacteroidia bacterium]
MEHKVTKIKLSAEAAYHKIKSWCAYQERSQNETLKKLSEFGLQQSEAEIILANLISENFVNEERFAATYASGKFRIKHWGRHKIKMGLREHKVSDYSLKNALQSIDENEYLETIEKLIQKKLETSKSLEDQKKKYQVTKYLISRGFEADIVTQQLNKILKGN